MLRVTTYRSIEEDETKSLEAHKPVPEDSDGRPMLPMFSVIANTAEEAFDLIEDILYSSRTRRHNDPRGIRQ